MVAKIFSYRQIFTFILGLSSGLPLLLTLGTLQAWMTDAKVDLGVIGLMSSVTLPYSLKFLWAPLVDRFHFKFLGRRRSWVFIFQLLCALSLVGLGSLNPQGQLLYFALMSLIVTFFSASQDIVVDAYRREILPEDELGLGSTMAISGYRVGLIIAGAGALKLAYYLGAQVGNTSAWPLVYYTMAAIMVALSLLTWLAPREDSALPSPQSLKESVLGPLVEFFKRSDVWGVLFFVLLYKVGDSMASTMTTPFILIMGYTKNQLADIVKIWGIIATFIGMFIGGIALIRIGLNRCLWIFGGLQAVSTYGFALLSTYDVHTGILAGVIAFENLASGMGTSAYAAFIAHMTNKKFTATQYALLSALMALPRTLFSAPTGYLAQNLGWHNFFLACTLMALPGIFLLKNVAPWGEDLTVRPKS